MTEIGVTCHDVDDGVGDTVIALASYELRHETRKKLRIGDRLGLSAQAAQAMLLRRG